MQFDPLRAFPYPVLRPGVDDYIDGQVQATAEFTAGEEGQEISVKVTFLVSVPEIVARVASGEADYVLVFSCRDTYYCLTCGGSSDVFDVKFPPGSLRGEVQIAAYVAATKPIADFVAGWINPEFGTGPFSFEVGSLLALDEPQTIYIDRDVFRPLSSVFVLVRDDALAGHEWQLDTGEEKVQIRVSPELKERIDAARNSKANRAVLMNSIYFAAVMQCLVTIKRDRADNLETSARWAKVIEQKCHNENIDIDAHEEYLIAERLMKAPFQLIDAYVFGGAPE